MTGLFRELMFSLRTIESEYEGHCCTTRKSER